MRLSSPATVCVRESMTCLYDRQTDSVLFFFSIESTQCILSFIMYAYCHCHTFIEAGGSSVFDCDDKSVSNVLKN